MPKNTPPIVRHRAAFSLKLPGPTDFAACVSRYTAFGPDEANRLTNGVLRFVRVIDGARFLVRVSATGGRESPGARVAVVGTATPGKPVLARLREEVRWRLGAGFDLPGFYKAAGKDSRLAPVLNACRGYRPPLTPDPFESLVTSITAQQINLAFAFTTRSRLVRAYGPAVRTPEGEHYRAFPRPEDLAGVREASLRKMQLSGVKSRAILGLAREARRGNVPFESFSAWDAARIQECLTAQYGIGRWTVDWFLSRSLGRGDAWPAGDLGVRKAVSWFYFGKKDQSEETVRAFGARFGEHRNLAAHYLLSGWTRARAAGRARKS
ncbi:MAG: DNA-3-methyladenine glycosylase family protein [Myxococcota bacterium]